jgi:tetratricopeptide (TPR) repeat protein
MTVPTPGGQGPAPGRKTSPTADPATVASRMAAAGASNTARPKVMVGQFLAGLPAVAAASAVVVALYMAPPAKSLTTRYRTEAESRIKLRDYAGAEVCFKRLLAINPDDREYRYMMVLVLEQLNQLEHAEAIARSIAPTDRTGLPAAHFWLARRILADQTRLRYQATLAEGHLLRFLQVAPNHDDGKWMIGSLYYRMGRYRDARPYLESVAGDHPERLLLLASVLKSLGEPEESLRRARSAQQLAKTRATARPDDKVARLVWADSCAFMDDYAGAINILEEGHVLSRDPLFRKQIASVCAAWANHEAEKKGEKGKLADRMNIIEQGLKIDPGNFALLDATSKLMAEGGEPGEKARATIRAALAEGRAPALAHFVLGNDAWSRDNFEEARSHWEQAYKLDSRFSTVANNLAWILAYKEPSDAPRALSMIDQALVAYPSSPQLRGTRGQILVKMERWKEAIPDLEVALASGENSSSMHEALAVAYDHSPMTGMAAEHRKALKKP